MRWLARGRPTPTRSLTTDALVAQALVPLAPHLAALTPLLPQAVVPQTLLPVLHRLVAFCWDLPASEAHHHGRPFGLLTHSLEVAQQALTTFTCEEGRKAFEAVAETVRTGEPATARLETVGRSPDGTVVARFAFTWSFKRRSKG